MIPVHITRLSCGDYAVSALTDARHGLHYASSLAPKVLDSLYADMCESAYEIPDQSGLAFVRMKDHHVFCHLNKREIHVPGTGIVADWQVPIDILRDAIRSSRHKPIGLHKDDMFALLGRKGMLQPVALAPTNAPGICVHTNIPRSTLVPAHAVFQIMYTKNGTRLAWADYSDRCGCVTGGVVGVEEMCVQSSEELVWLYIRGCLRRRRQLIYYTPKMLGMPHRAFLAFVEKT